MPQLARHGKPAATGDKIAGVQVTGVQVTGVQVTPAPSQVKIGLIDTIDLKANIVNLRAKERHGSR
ncbi:hypothetical protein ThrDRAFT_00062 [Frankia casuarinae]|jgi:hypothetical protein|uniref:hypothetical protein n=1 Tax=Frankia casuarinae (strain DSM 45818 / CECT 9043 / HFP020203 / CcI3) TaxID=106370 RepID=UPI00044B0411|nr:hypothetical protein [Frankia casuarinae]EYT94138.1 hypothetical protein ThrDRAFT_00062 [Frankia casuarinae]